MKVLLDSNLATLLVLGSTDLRLVGAHKRIRKYSRRDFDDLTDELSRTDAIVFLPNALSEISNLLGFGVDGDLKRRIFDRFRDVIRGSEEHYAPSSDACERTEFARLA